VPCTVTASGCTCQPANSEPSYERISLRLRIRSFNSCSRESRARGWSSNYFMRQALPCNPVIARLPRSLAVARTVSASACAALERESAVSDILLPFTKLSSRARFSVAFQEPEYRRLRTNI
jgi:hypothetical protein